MKSISHYWYSGHPALHTLAPLAALYRAVVGIRRAAFQAGLLPQAQFSVPVVVVGNISVGGTGKTPLVIAIVKHLSTLGFKPGLVSRGYGARAKDYPLFVGPHADPVQVGDEAALMVKQCHCPMVISPNRAAAVKQLLKEHECDIVISDDGLQHYALQRDIEVAVVDAERQHGNGYCLPAGPLREPVSRLNSVDFIVNHGQIEAPYTMQLEAGDLYNLADPTRNSSNLLHNQPVHAVAGIGHPQRFFKQLRALGFQIIEHPFPDHHRFLPEDLCFADDYPILMTEKDAVKCRGFATEAHWVLPVQARVSANFFTDLMTSLGGITNATSASAEFTSDVA